LFLYNYSKSQLQLAETIGDFSLIGLDNQVADKNEDLKTYLTFIPAAATYSLGGLAGLNFQGGLDAVANIKKSFKKLRHNAKKAYKKYLKKLKKAQAKQAQRIAEQNAAQARQRAYYRRLANQRAEKAKKAEKARQAFFLKQQINQFLGYGYNPDLEQDRTIFGNTNISPTNYSFKDIQPLVMPNGFKINPEDVVPAYEPEKSWWEKTKDFGKGVLKVTWNIAKWLPPIAAGRLLWDTAKTWYDKKENEQEKESRKKWEKEEKIREERIRAEKKFDDYKDIPEDARLDSLLARKVYKSREFVELPAGVREATAEELAMLGVDSNEYYDDEKSGLRMRVYFNENTGKFSFSFAGTDPNDPKDVETDIRQSRGLETGQYNKVAELAKIIQKKIESGELDGNMLEATGQSLGGGLAALFGAVTKCKTKTFNAAGVHSETLRRAGVEEKDIRTRNFSNITNNVAAGDILTYIQEDATAQDLEKINKAIQEIDDVPVLGDIAVKIGQDKAGDKLSAESLRFISERLKHTSDINQELPDALGSRIDYGSQQRVTELNERVDEALNSDQKTYRVVGMGVKLYDMVAQHGNY